jgi:hypothetical protein
MKCVRILPLVVLFALNAVAQSDPWAPVRAFEGKWQGSVTGKPGKQLSSREYQFVSDGTFLWQHDHSVYEAKSPNAAPEVREDFGYFSYDKFLKKIVWRQFHSEGFVNEYRLDSVSADGKLFEFITVRIENLPAGWRAKKSYRLLSADELEETFSLAPPDKEFEIYTVAHLRRVK